MAACPLYLPAEHVRPEVLALEAALKLASAPMTVAGVQYATESDASLARRHEAEYQLRQAERRAQLWQTCVWCGETFRAADAVLQVGARRMHDGRCSAEFDATQAPDAFTFTECHT